MQLGKSQRTNQFLESLKAEGEVILEDVQPKLGQSTRPAAPPATDPVTLTVEEKLNVTLKRDGGVGNFDVQGTLSLQILNQEDGYIQVQVHFLSVSLYLNLSTGRYFLLLCVMQVVFSSKVIIFLMQMYTWSSNLVRWGVKMSVWVSYSYKTII